MNNNSANQTYMEILDNIAAIKSELMTLPKGYIRSKMIREREYYYHQYRDGKQIVSKYITKEDRKKLEPQIERRKELSEELKRNKRGLSNLEKNLGIHHYRPVKNINYQDYVLFMSSVSHEYKRLGKTEFLLSIDTRHYRGIQKRYLKAFINYLTGNTGNTRQSEDLILDPYTYTMYFDYGIKNVLEEELKKAIPAFLEQGLLITNIQEAVWG